MRFKNKFAAFPPPPPKAHLRGRSYHGGALGPNCGQKKEGSPQTARTSSAPTPDSADTSSRIPNRNPANYDGAEAALIKGFAGQVWALHTALQDPVWDRCKTFLPRNFRAQNSPADGRRPKRMHCPPPLGRVWSFSKTSVQMRPRHPAPALAGCAFLAVAAQHRPSGSSRAYNLSDLVQRSVSRLHFYSPRSGTAVEFKCQAQNYSTMLSR